METPSIRAQCLGSGFASALRLLSTTWRIDCVQQQVLDQLVECRERHILAFWHRHYITLFRLFRNQSIIALTNQSPRGQVIANICLRNDIQTLQVRGHGMKQTLRSLETLANGNLGLAITVDGPLGPACEVKPAVLHLAARLGWPIVPLSVAAGCKHVCASRWDRLEIPHILSRVSFVIGTPIHVAQFSSRSDLRELAVQLKEDIDDGTSFALERVSARL
jgi:lysophospholipid acyltransferase (LPLAT)-like uncharacterized protein